jgi:hypothetical protein
MSDLSPAAQSVLNASTSVYWRPLIDVPTFQQKSIAAALRAALEQVMPEVVNAVGDEHDDARRDQWVRIRCKFLAIANELEAQ